MDSKLLRERLRYRGEEDFRRLLHTYLQEDSFDYNRKIRPFFDCVRGELPACMNHKDEVLALSIGGSTTKLMLAGTAEGQMQISHLVVVKNPTILTHFYDFLDALFLKDPCVRRYLETAKSPSLCVTLPVMIGEDQIPFHPVKIAYITHMLARNDAEMTEELNLGNNLRRYFCSRRIRTPLLYFQSDPVIAHLGGLFQLVQKPKDARTLLLVCGTGMATADDNYQRVISRLRMMDFDEGLYPEEFTEGYVYETACSGKGLFDIMRRAIRIRAKEPDSQLQPENLEPYFSDLYDSVTVAKIWESSIDPDFCDETVCRIREAVGAAAMTELEEIAGMIMDRVIGSLANAILVSAVKIDREEGKGRYFLLFEGSIALDPYIHPRIKEVLQSRLKEPSLFIQANMDPPEILFEKCAYKPLLFSESVPLELKPKVDITLIGTAVAAVVREVLARENAGKTIGAE